MHIANCSCRQEHRQQGESTETPLTDGLRVVKFLGLDKVQAFIQLRRLELHKMQTSTKNWKSAAQARKISGLLYIRSSCKLAFRGGMVRMPREVDQLYQRACKVIHELRVTNRSTVATKKLRQLPNSGSKLETKLQI